MRIQDKHREHASACMKQSSNKRKTTEQLIGMGLTKAQANCAVKAAAKKEGVYNALPKRVKADNKNRRKKREVQEER